MVTLPCELSPGDGAGTHPATLGALRGTRAKQCLTVDRRKDGGPNRLQYLEAYCVPSLVCALVFSEVWERHGPKLHRACTKFPCAKHLPDGILYLRSLFCLVPIHAWNELGQRKRPEHEEFQWASLRKQIASLTLIMRNQTHWAVSK